MNYREEARRLLRESDDPHQWRARLLALRAREWSERMSAAPELAARPPFVRDWLLWQARVKDADGR
ncbi:MAG TPA: hypothetical protein DEH78_08180 [Solibacterales bacterium]|nr:hypothetical protein [Bryobacterales bacterium]